jgi:aminopeptidase-like protein
MTPNGRFPEYHTSADNLNFIQAEYLADSFSKYLSVLSVLDNNKKCLNQNPKCEPQLGKRGLYSSIGANEPELLWVLNLSDGNHTLLDIAEKANVGFDSTSKAEDALSKHGLLTEQTE